MSMNEAVYRLGVGGLGAAAPPQPERQSEVRQALAELDLVTCQIFASLETLTGRLMPVLVANPAEVPEKNRGEVKQAWRTPLARELGQAADRLSALNSYILRIVEALEL
jgi:hypothetical protein